MKVLLRVFCVTPAGVLPQCVLLKHIPEAYFVVKTIESRVSKNENNLFYEKSELPEMQGRENNLWNNL